MNNLLTEQYDNQPALVDRFDGTISFTKVNLQYGWLGNMSPYPVHYNGLRYRTAEALFQSLRFSNHPHVQHQIIDAKSPMCAKMIAKKYRPLLTEDDYEHDVNNMEFCLRLKLDQHPQLVPLLDETEDKMIVEDCTNRSRSSRALYWGAKWDAGTQSWIGLNVLGILWMGIRYEKSREWCPHATFSVN